MAKNPWLALPITDEETERLVALAQRHNHFGLVQPGSNCESSLAKIVDGELRFLRPELAAVQKDLWLVALYDGATGSKMLTPRFMARRLLLGAKYELSDFLSRNKGALAQAAVGAGLWGLVAQYGDVMMARPATALFGTYCAGFGMFDAIAGLARIDNQLRGISPERFVLLEHMVVESTKDSIQEFLDNRTAKRDVVGDVDAINAFAEKLPYDVLAFKMGPHLQGWLSTWFTYDRAVQLTEWALRDMGLEAPAGYSTGFVNYLIDGGFVGPSHCGMVLAYGKWCDDGLTEKLQQYARDLGGLETDLQISGFREGIQHVARDTGAKISEKAHRALCLDLDNVDRLIHYVDDVVVWEPNPGGLPKPRLRNLERQMDAIRELGETADVRAIAYLVRLTEKVVEERNGLKMEVLPNARGDLAIQFTRYQHRCSGKVVWGEPMLYWTVRSILESAISSLEKSTGAGAKDLQNQFQRDPLSYGLIMALGKHASV
ncbi:MAG: hypothetical protein ABIG95_01800 [Candidatus Woesearchaeota archaeon]